MVETPKLRVEVAYAKPNRQVLEEIRVPTGSSVRDTIEASGLLARFPEIDLAVNKVGIFGRLVELTTIIRDGDRVEIYRPLIADPKQVRRELARQGKVMGKRKRD